VVLSTDGRRVTAACTPSEEMTRRCAGRRDVQVCDNCAYIPRVLNAVCDLCGPRT